MVVASKHLTAAVLTCQLQCLNNPSWWEDSSFISSCFSHTVRGQMGPALLSHSSWSLSNPFFWLITGKSNNWHSQSSAVCWSSDLAPGRAAFSSWKMGGFLCHCSFRVALPTRRQSQEELWDWAVNQNQKPSLETCCYQSYGSVLEKEATWSNI